MIYILQAGVMGTYLLALAAFAVVIVILVVKDLLAVMRGNTPVRQFWGEGRTHETH